MKSIKGIAVFLALLVCLSGCAGTHQSGGSYNIYLIAKSSTTEFWKAVFSGANAAKSEYNVQLTILAPDTEEDFEVYRKRYSPYGTLASLYLWRIKDGGLSVK